MYQQSLSMLINYFRRHPRNLFLTDAVGAILSAVLLAVVLAQFEGLFGMPRPVLYRLALIACLLASWSFGCYWRVGAHWKPFLLATAFANLVYCAVTAGCLYYYYTGLSALGVTYFLLEMLVVLGLVVLEIRTARG
jgi:hypothetical protein